MITNFGLTSVNFEKHANNTVSAKFYRKLGWNKVKCGDLKQVSN